MNIKRCNECGNEVDSYKYITVISRPLNALSEVEKREKIHFCEKCFLLDIDNVFKLKHFKYLLWGQKKDE
jgi:hypothetical protein